MKTMNNTIINSIMNKYMKYICAVLLVVGTSAHAWGTHPGTNYYTLLGGLSDISDGDAVILYDDVNNVGVTGTSGTSATYSSTRADWIEYTVIKNGTIRLGDWSILAAPEIYADEDGNKYKFTYAAYGGGTSFSVNSSGYLTYGTTRLAHDGDYIRFYSSAGTALKVYKVNSPKNIEQVCDGNLCINPDAISMGGEWDGGYDVGINSGKFIITTNYKNKQHRVYVECNETNQMWFGIYDWAYVDDDIEYEFGSNGYFTPSTNNEIEECYIKCWAYTTGTYHATLHVYAYNIDGNNTEKHVSIPVTISVLPVEQECTPSAPSFTNEEVTIYWPEQANQNYTQTVSRTGTGAISYSITDSDPANCASINESTGQVHFTDFGVIEVTATVEATATHCIGRASYLLTMACKSRSLNFASGSSSITINDSYTRTATASAGSGDITYSITTSINNNVDINESTGALTINGPDMIEVTATIAASGGYCEASTSYELEINPVVPTVSGFSSSSDANSMTLSGSEVTNKGGANITAYGYLYSTTATTASTLKLGESGVTTAQVAGADININTPFADKTISSLASGETYYVRAYATNSAGTGYSEIQTVRTVVYTDYKFTCSELSLDNEELSKVVWMTTYAGEVVRSANPVFKISGTGLKPGAAITFTIGGSSANSTSDIISFRTASYGSISADATTGELAETEVYAFYNPTATTDGLDQYASGTEIVATAAGGTYSSRTYMELTATLANVAINGRHLPSQFVIAAKWGGTWYALPADFTKTTSDADCNGIPVAISVDADGSGNPTLAYGPSSLAYAVNMVGSGGTGTATFISSGKYLYLDMINNSHYALEAAGSGTSVARGSGNAATGDLGANYMWLLDQQTAAASSTAETEYHICNAANTTYPLKLYSTENRWGLYSAGTNVATPAIRLIPLSEVEPLELSVLEWGETSIAVKSASVNLSSGYTVTARLGTAAAAAVSSVSKIGDDLYIIRGVGSLLTGSGIGVRSLTITATPAEGTAKQAVLQVPLIISNDAATSPEQYVTYTEKQISSFAAGGTGTDKVSEGRNIVKTIDVVVRKGGKLTNESTASGDFADLHIYSGGKVDITQGIKFKNVYLRGGFSWLDNQFDSLPRLKTEGNNITLGSGGKVYYDLCLNSDMYYMMALPVDVSLTSVTNEENTSTFKAWIKKYNGGARAGENSDPKWISVTSGSLERGVGYEVAIKKRNNRPYGILRFPLLSSWSAETDFTPTVTAWGIDATDGLKEGVTANNAGWNLVGNPFFTAFHNTNVYGSKVVNYGFKPHGDPWDGTYDWDQEDASVIKFFSVPYRSYDDWHDERAIDAVLEPFFPFGVQVKSTGVLSFKEVNRNLKPSIIRKSVQEREVDVDFLLKDANGKTDNAGLTIGNAYSELFDSEDMEKTVTGGTQYMKVYTMVGKYRTAFNYLPEDAAAQPIPVGYIAPTAGNYTFTLKPNGNYSEVKKVLLTDYTTSRTVDLLTEDYSFETEAGEINTRFALNVILKAEVPSDIENIQDADIWDMSVYGGEKHLVVRGLPTGTDVWVYDATGKLVATWSHVTEASVQTDVPAAGVYNVRAVHGGQAVTKGTVVR